MAAQARVHSIELELVAERDRTRRAILQYEVGALLEHRLKEEDEAARRYLAAYNLQPRFRPPLFALARIYRARRSFKNMDRILDAAARGAEDPVEKATILSERAWVLHDFRADPEAALALWQQALALDPRQRTAPLMLEHHQRASGQLREAERTLELRAQRTGDPHLRAALLREVAEAALEQGEVEQALEALQAARELGVDARRTLLALAALGRSAGRPQVLLAALDGLAQDAVSGAVAARVPAAPDAAAAWHREAAHERMLADDVEAALASLGQAVAHAPLDPLPRLEQLAALGRAGAHEDLIRDARTLLTQQPGARLAAWLHFRIAEAEQALGHADAVRTALRAALSATPDSAAAVAVLEDAYLDANLPAELADALDARAGLAHGEARGRLLWHAAELRFDALNDSNGAHDAYARAAQSCSDPLPVWRSLHGLACLRGEHGLAARAASTLLQLDLDPDERSALTLDLYRRTARELADPETAAEILDAALDDESCAGWAPDCVRIHAALTANHTRLARAHGVLAERADDAATGAAHLCAAARAQKRSGDPALAIETLRDALVLSPANAYALALLEELLLERGDAREAVQLLREAAAMEQDARKSELALLHAGAAAEGDGDLATAAQSYEAAIARDPRAISPLWALRRIAEQTGDAAMRVRALQGLAGRALAPNDAALRALELAEAHDHLGSFELTLEPLQRALNDGLVADRAALALLLSPQAPGLDPLRDAALAHLSRGNDSLSQLCARERLSAVAHVDAARAAGLLMQTRWGSGLQGWRSAVPVFAADSAMARSEAFSELGAICADPEAGAELRLHGIRTLRHAGGEEANDDALMLALELAEAAPDALATAVALDEALSSADDPDARAGALQRRLEHTRPEMASGLRSAHARALMRAGRSAEAAEAARRAIEVDADDLAAWDLLRVAARATGDWNAVVDAANKLSSQTTGAQAGMLLEEAADVLLEQLEQHRAAEEQLRHALTADPTRPGPFAKLHDLLLRRRNWKGLLHLLEQRLRHVRDVVERADLLYEQALVLRCTGARESALVAIDELLAIEPRHCDGLSLLSSVHQSLRQWPQAVAALRQLIAHAVGAARESAIEEAATILDVELDDPKGAHDVLQAWGDEPPADPAWWLRLGTLAERAERLGPAADALTRAAELTRGRERAGLERRSGELHERAGHDPEPAIAAYRRALEAHPGDMDAAMRLRRVLQDPAERARVLTTLIASIQAALDRAPTDPELLRKLRQAADWAQDRTLQRVALGALCALGLANEEEGHAHHAWVGEPRPLKLGRIESAQWQRLCPALEPSALALAMAVSESLSSTQRRAPSVHGAQRGDRVGRFADNGVRDEVAAIVSALGGELHEFHFGGRPPHGICLVSGGPKGQVWVADPSLHAPLSDELRFRIARSAMAAQLGVLELASLPTGAARRAIHAHALVLGRTLEGCPDPGSLADVVAGYDRSMPRGARRAVGAALGKIDDTVLVNASVDALQLACLRAALAVSEALPPALCELLGESFTAEDAGASPHASAIVRYYTSMGFVELRKALEDGPGSSGEGSR